MHALKTALAAKDKEASEQQKQLEQQTALFSATRSELDGVHESLAVVRQRLSNSGDKGDLFHGLSDFGLESSCHKNGPCTVSTFEQRVQQHLDRETSFVGEGHTFYRLPDPLSRAAKFGVHTEKLERSRRSMDELKQVLAAKEQVVSSLQEEAKQTALALDARYEYLADAIAACNCCMHVQLLYNLCCMQGQHHRGTPSSPVRLGCRPAVSRCGEE